MQGLQPYLLVAGVAAMSSYLFTPVVRWGALRFGAVDHPSDRKVHAVPTPTLGGVGMFAAFLVSLFVASRLPSPAFREIFRFTQPRGLLLGTALMLVIGIVDDLKGLTAPAKLAGQIFAAGVMTLTGVQVVWFWLPWLGNIALSSDVGVPLTIAIIVISVNAVNLVDGLDGLAAGLVAIGALAYFIYSYHSGESGLFLAAYPATLVGAILVGICVGFLPHNFNPARIFMGDAGAMVLGTLLAGATVMGIGESSQPLPPNPAQQVAVMIPAMIPVVVLALPFADVVLAVLRRLRSGTGVMTADKAHLHHRLLDIGHSHRRAVLLLWAWSALLAGSAVALAFVRLRTVVPVFVLVALLGVMLARTPTGRPSQ